MEAIHKRVAGLDVHKKSVVACVRLRSGRKVQRECRTFETTTAGLEALLAWLEETHCTHVAMEETGIYWRPVWNILSDGNVKLDAVISDILGTSGRRMIEAMIAGESNPQTLAALAARRLKAKPGELRGALHGRLNQTHRFLLRTHLKQWDELDAAIGEIDRQVDALIAGMQQAARFRLLIALLCKIPGVSKLAAISILAEIGIDMRRFPTAGHLVACAGLCPGQNQSAGKRKSSRLRKGAPWLKTMLVQCAWAAKRQNNSYYKA